MTMGKGRPCVLGHKSDLTSLYRLRSHSKVLLYVGITNNLSRRLHEHEAKKDWYWQVDHIEVTNFACRECAEWHETGAIQEESPRYNVKHAVDLEGDYATTCPSCASVCNPWDDSPDEFISTVRCAYQCRHCGRAWAADWHLCADAFNMIGVVPQ